MSICVKARCVHGKNKYSCRECGGKLFCIHGRQKPQCRDCGQGSAICEHNRRKSTCKECIGTSICEHLHLKTTCKECKGLSICEHEKQRSFCKLCKGTSICVHNRQKSYCRDCGNCSALCEHDKQKQYCRPCGGGSALCNNTWCDTYGNNKYEGFCLPCFVNNPDNHLKPAMHNYKTKEKAVVDSILESFPQFTWVSDRKVSDGCSRRRPDLLLDMGSHIIIVEVDENAHTGYSCENMRIMELSQDLNHRPIIFIRFNPDGYTTIDGLKIKSCWKLNKLGIMRICNLDEWETRIERLKEQIQYCVENNSGKMVDSIELFY